MFRTVLLVGVRELAAPDPVRLVGRDRGRERDAGLGAAVQDHPIDVEQRLAVAHEHAAVAQARKILGAALVGRVGVRRAAWRQIDLGPRDVEEARGPGCLADRSRAARCGGSSRAGLPRARGPRRCSRRRRAARLRRPRSGRARNCEARRTDHGLTARGRASAPPGGHSAAERRRLGTVRSDRTGRLVAGPSAMDGG
jgi:hypothetical protein